MLATGNRKDTKITFGRGNTFNLFEHMIYWWLLGSCFWMGSQNFLNHDAYYIMGRRKPKITSDILSLTRHGFSAEQIIGSNLAYNTGWTIRPGLVACPSHSPFLSDSLRLWAPSVCKLPLKLPIRSTDWKDNQRMKTAYSPLRFSPVIPWGTEQTAVRN